MSIRTHIMKTKTNYLLALFLLSLACTSCNKFLDVTPDQRADLEKNENIGELLATAYPQANYIPFTEAISDNAGDKGSGTVSQVNSAPFLFQDVADIYSDSPTYYWNAAYKAIAAANHALQAIERQGKGTTLNAFKGEALVARAYAHFMLVKLFAWGDDPKENAGKPGIPYVTSVEDVVVKKYERGTVGQVYEAIEKDLLAGLPLLDDRIYKSPKYHFTTNAAHAFASRFYLFKKNYAKVIEHSNLVLGSGDPKSLLRQVNSATYRSLQYYELEAQYTRAENAANILLVEAPSIWGRSYPRYRYSFDYPTFQSLFGSNVSGGSWGYNIYGNDVTLNIPKFREHFVRQDLHAETGIPYNMIPLFTMEEVLFNRAEANSMLGNFDAALVDLNHYVATRMVVSQQNPVFSAALLLSRNKLLNFYETSDLQYALVQCVLDLKRFNFMHEGMRWFDIIRHKLKVVHRTTDGKVLTLGPNDPMRIFQIPQEAQSSGIELNPR